MGASQEAVLRSSLKQHAVPEAVLQGAYLSRQWSSRNGVTHLIFRQKVDGIEVENASWVVNLDRQGGVLNSGGQLFARGSRTAPSESRLLQAVNSAARAVRPGLARTWTPAAPRPTSRGTFRMAAPNFGDDLEAHRAWWGSRGELHPAWAVSVVEANRVSRHTVWIDADTLMTLENRARTWYDGPAALVFDHGTPTPNPQPGTLLTAAPPFVSRTLQPVPPSWGSGNSTAGNNTVVGPDPNGALPYDAQPTVAGAQGLAFDLLLGPSAPNPLLFANAADVDAFYWVNQAHDWFYEIGFDEAAGNYQQDNFGKGGIPGDPMLVYTAFDAQDGAMNNSFFTSAAADDGNGER